MLIFYGMKAYTCCKIIEVLLVTRERADLKLILRKLNICVYVRM